jgi:intracellular sulfur oxidation DsrE/DsrF family protein
MISGKIRDLTIEHLNKIIKNVSFAINPNTDMSKQLFLLMFTFISFHFATGQSSMSDSLRKAKDSTLRAIFHEDSLKVSKDYAEKEKWERIYARAEYPLLKGSKNSGVIPVTDPTEIPDPNIEYKIIFEVVSNNPDSTIKEINAGLDEVARVINLHVASGIPVKKIIPVIVVHAAALNAIKNNEAFQKKYKTDNPNLKLISDMEKMGARFIACGQAMAFFDVRKEELLPEVKISLTAQTVITSYQLKGYVWHPVY